MNFWQAIKSGFSNYVNFSDRAIRSEYWFWILFTSLASAVTWILSASNPGLTSISGILSLAIFLPSLALAVRRLHDLDRAGWWLLIAFTFIGVFLLIYWASKKGTPGPNRFGPDPFAAGQLGPRPANQTTDPVERIVAWTCGIGGVSATVGFFGPMFFGNSNLGPFFGIIIMLPLGTLAGALVGAVSVAQNSARLAIAWIMSLWVMTLLCMLFMIGLFGPFIAILSLPLQLLVVASSIFIFSRRDARTQLPDGMRRSGPIAVAALVTILLMTLFPPVIRPSWLPTTTAPVPSFAFIFDSRFFSRGPDIAVNPGALAREWTITAAVAIGLCLLMWALCRRPVV